MLEHAGGPSRTWFVNKSVLTLIDYALRLVSADCWSICWFKVNNICFFLKFITWKNSTACNTAIKNICLQRNIHILKQFWHFLIDINHRPISWHISYVIYNTWLALRAGNNSVPGITHSQRAFGGLTKCSALGSEELPQDR